MTSKNKMTLACPPERQKFFHDVFQKAFQRSQLSHSKDLSAYIYNFCEKILTSSTLQPFIAEIFLQQQKNAIDYVKKYIGKRKSQLRRNPHYIWGKGGTPSYGLLRKNYVKPFTSFRSKEDQEILNDNLVIVQEAYKSSCPKLRDGARYKHQEALESCEDDHYEQDLLRETITSTICAVEKLMEYTEAADFQIRDLSWEELEDLSPIHKRCIQTLDFRSYGKKYGLSFIEQAQENPAGVLPTILEILKQKQELEWPELELRKKNIQWAKKNSEHYHKSLDYSLPVSMKEKVSNTKQNQRKGKLLGVDSFPAQREDAYLTEEDISEDKGQSESLSYKLLFENPQVENVERVIRYLLTDNSIMLALMTEEQFEEFAIIWWDEIAAKENVTLMTEKQFKEFAAKWWEEVVGKSRSNADAESLNLRSTCHP